MRKGHHVAAVPEELIPQQHRNQYMTYIRRANRSQQVELYPMPLRQRLPDIRIPLRPRDNEVLLQIQLLIDQCYQDGRYWRTDYTQPLHPELSDQDAGWLKTLLVDSTQAENERLR